MDRTVLVYDLEQVYEDEVQHILDHPEEYEDAYDPFEREHILQCLYEDPWLQENAWEDVCHSFAELLDRANSIYDWEVHPSRDEPYIHYDPPYRLLTDCAPREGIEHLRVDQHDDQFQIVFNRNPWCAIWLIPNRPAVCPCCEGEFQEIDEKEHIDSYDVCWQCYEEYGDDWPEHSQPSIAQEPLVLDTRFVIDGIPYGF